MAKTGRPPKEIDWNTVDMLLKSQCDGVAIAEILGVCPDTLYRDCVKTNKMTFSKYSTVKKTEGKELLRAKQYQVAMSGDRTMLVWLGKQYLNQTDRRNIAITDDMDKTREREIFLSKMRRVSENQDEQPDGDIQKEEQ